MARDGAMKSLWENELEQFKPTTQHNPKEIYDILIVGGGITGLTTGVLLQQQGQKCILAEAHSIGFGTTGGTTAHLNTVLDTPYYVIEENFGKEAARLVAQGTAGAIQLIDNFTGKAGIDCGFAYRRGYIFAQSEEEAKELDRIRQSAERAGIQTVDADTVPLPIPHLQAWGFEGQAEFHPGQYLTGMAGMFEEAGGTIMHNCMVTGSDHDEYHTVLTTSGDIKARCIVYATHIPPGISILHFRCAPYRSYAAAYTLPDGEYPEGLFYDMKDPYRYIRTQEANGERYMIVGGFDHKTGHEENTQQCFRELDAYVNSYFTGAEAVYRWSSQYYNSADGLPYIGRLPGHDTIYTATGFIGNGMVYGTLAGQVITDMILERPTPYADLFAPSRIKPIAGFAEFVKENADVVSKFIGMRFSYEQISSLASLAPGEALLADWEDKKVAIYKDDAGRVYALDPVCTHAGCIVSWNNAEKSWDCPCHGGRYAPDGTVITGPPRARLNAVM